LRQAIAQEDKPTLPNRRRAVLALGASAAIGIGTLYLALRKRSPPLEQPLLTYRELQWEDLMPKEWDPTKRLRKQDGSLLTDLDPQAQKMLADLRAIWDNAPIVGSLDGVAVRLPGYVVPQDQTDGALTEFLLVPYFGACIHSPPPPANQIVHVIPDKPTKGFHAMDTVWVSGRLTTLREDSPMGASGYRLDARVVLPYKARPS
jgi:hypothetical protein